MELVYALTGVSRQLKTFMLSCMLKSQESFKVSQRLQISPTPPGQALISCKGNPF